MESFAVFSPSSFGWIRSSLGARRFVTMEAAIKSAERNERGAFQVRSIDERGHQAIVHERLR